MKTNVVITQGFDVVDFRASAISKPAVSFATIQNGKLVKCELANDIAQSMLSAVFNNLLKDGALLMPVFGSDKEPKN